MPLKHPTETLLVFILGIMIVLTGILLSTIPALPRGMLPWLMLFFLALSYPLAFNPFLRRNRADYAFRFLHFAPAAMALFWFLLQILTMRFPALGTVLRGYLFAWTLPGVAVSFLFLGLFVLHVIRRWEVRLALLAALFVPFMIISTLSETTMDGSNRLAAALWQGNWWDVTDTASSSVPARSQDVEGGTSSPLRMSSSSRPLVMSSSSSRPTRLPSAGVGLDLLAVTILALYSGTLHRRAARRRV